MKETALLLLGTFAAITSGIVVKRFRPGLSERKAEAIGTAVLVLVLLWGLCTYLLFR